MAVADWLEGVRPITQEGQIRVPYTWSVGETGSRFLAALRDEGKILANRCPRCSQVYVPPRKNCGMCFSEIGDKEWLALAPEGTVTAYTVVRTAHPLNPAEPPFAYVLVRLYGATVDFLHLVKGEADRLEIGCRVKARFRKERTGLITDIDSFEPA